MVEGWKKHPAGSRFSTILDDLTSRNATEQDPPSRQGTVDLKIGTKVMLKTPATEEEWLGVNNHAPSFVSLVGPGNEDLDKLPEIAAGLPWVVFGILFCYHPIPVPNKEDTGNPAQDFDYRASAGLEDKLVKYPLPQKVAKLAYHLTFRMKLSAHLNDGWAQNVYEGRKEVFKWLDACQFRFVQLNHDAYGLREFWKTHGIPKVAENVVKLMQEFPNLTVVLPSSGSDVSTKLNTTILSKGLVNVFLLHDRSLGTGQEAWIFPPPQDSVPCGYAGGFTPENILKKLDLIPWRKVELPYFIDLQTGLRSSPSPQNKYGIFEVEKAKAVLRIIANDPRFNPAQGQEVFREPDTSLRLGCKYSESGPSVVLQPPPENYEVADVDGKNCRFSLRLGTTISPMIAASVLGKLKRVDGKSLSLRPTPVKRDGQVRGGEPLLAEALSLREPEQVLELQPKLSLGERYKNKTPGAYLSFLGEQLQDAKKVKSHRMAEEGEAVELLRKWSTGQLLTYESGLGSGRFLSLSSKGFPGLGRTGKEPWDGSLKERPGRAVAIVSMPGDNQKLFNSVTRICLEEGMFFAVVWESDWPESMWFFVWLRNTVRAYLDGYVPLVLTRQRGMLGNAQKVEVCALQALELPFVCMEMNSFVKESRPFHGAILEEGWGELQDLLWGRKDLPGKQEIARGLKSHDGQGFTPLILATDQGVPLHLLNELICAKANPNDTDSHGRTALHWAARRFAKSAESGEGYWIDLISLLLSTKEAHETKNFGGETALDYAKRHAGSTGTKKVDKFRELLERYKPKK